MNGEAPEPWIEGDLTISGDVLRELHEHALATYPSECCGFVRGPAAAPLALDSSERVDNEADKYHALDPETFPRTSRTYFKINELKAFKAFEAAQKNGTPIKVIYHSHCDAGAYFSAEDAATFAHEGKLTWPCAFIVVSVQDQVVTETKLWVHVPNTNDFRESALTVQ